MTNFKDLETKLTSACAIYINDMANTKVDYRAALDAFDDLIVAKSTAMGQDYLDAEWDMHRVLYEGNPKEIRKQVGYWVNLDPENPEANEALLAQF